MKTASGAGMRRGAVLWAAIFALDLVVGAASPVWSQRRRVEPEADPQFQSQAQQASSGGPIESPEPVAQEQPSPEAEGGPAQVPSAPARRQAGRRIRVGAASSEAAPIPPPADVLETRIVVRVKNAPLTTFLDTISLQAKISFIVTDGLEDRKISAFLQNVTVREALQILLEIKGLTYQRIGRSNTYVVSKRAAGVPNRVTRIYTLNHIPLVPLTAGKTDFSQTPTGSGQMALSGMGAGMGGQPGGSPDVSSGGSGSQGEGIPKTDDAAILKVLDTVLTKAHGRVAVDARTNSLIITDLPEVFPQVEQILAELDKKAPQVMIEAQIVEMNSDHAQQLGIEWGGPTGELASFTGPRRDTNFPLNMPREPNNFHFFDPVGGVLSAVGGSSGAESQSQTSSAQSSSQDMSYLFRSNLYTGVLDLTSLKVVLRALVSRATARFLGKPKILTLNNKPAVIQVAQNQATALTQNQSGGGGLTMSSNSVERFNTGLVLRVTPQVNSEGYITMLVEPSFSNVIESKISSLAQPVYDPTTRAASTLVRVKNSQTLVLGGLLESRETKIVRKVPFLGYIPLIGWLFTSTSSQRMNTDLVIFITPTIVTD